MSASLLHRKAPLAGLALACTAGLILSPSPAHAVVLGTPELSHAVLVNFGPGCTVSGPGAVPETTTAYSTNGGPVTGQASTTATVTKTGDSTDQVFFSASVRSAVTAAESGGALRSVRLSSHVEASSSATKPSPGCGSFILPEASASGDFDLPTAKVGVVEVTSTGGISAEAFLGGGPGAGGQSVGPMTAHGSMTYEAYLGPGAYTFALRGRVQRFSSSALATDSGDVVMSITLSEPGAATGVAEGKASKYVDLAAGRGCAAGSLSATWRSKAGKKDHRTVKKAVFSVGGAKVATVRKPKKGQVTVLTGLPRTGTDVEVALKLAKKGAGRVSVERSYLRCG